jgi:hypothetical protein
MRRISSMAVGLGVWACLSVSLGCQSDAPARRNNPWGGNGFSSGNGAAPAGASAPRGNAPAGAMANNPYTPPMQGSPSAVRPTNGTSNFGNVQPTGFNAPAQPAGFGAPAPAAGGTLPASFGAPAPANVSGGPSPYSNAPAMNTPNIATPGPGVQYSQPTPGMLPPPVSPNSPPPYLPGQ